MSCSKALIQICLLCSVLVLMACKPKPVTVATPAIRPEVAEIVAQANARMRESHLYAWKQAESLYQKAYALAPAKEIQSDLMLARFLTLVRQIDEDIPCPEAETLIRELGTGDAYQRNLGIMAEWILNGRKVGQLKLNAPIFRGQDPALESYINLLLFEATPRFDAFSSQSPQPTAQESPLFLYLNTAKLTSIDSAEFERRYPQFAEGYACLADHYYQKKQYRKALSFYEKAVDLIPEYINALVGLGNLNFYILEDYARAMRYYDTAIKRDTSSAAALFGKSLVLQQLEEYSESNALLDRMLSGRLARHRWIEGVPDAQYYQGEGHYLKAYNHYLMNDPVKAREYVDIAAKFLPDAAEIRYLSGLLYYESKNMEPARRDFLHVTQMGNYNCNAQMNLGFIYEQFKETYGTQPLPGDKEPAAKKSLQYFVAAAGCMEAVSGSLSYQIKNLNTLDLDPKEIAALKVRLEQKLTDVRSSSATNIGKITSRVSASSEPEKDVFLKHLQDILTRLRST